MRETKNGNQANSESVPFQIDTASLELTLLPKPEIDRLAFGEAVNYATQIYSLMSRDAGGLFWRSDGQSDAETMAWARRSLAIPERMEVHYVQSLLRKAGWRPAEERLYDFLNSLRSTYLRFDNAIGGLMSAHCELAWTMCDDYDRQPPKNYNKAIELLDGLNRELKSAVKAGIYGPQTRLTDEPCEGDCQAISSAFKYLLRNYADTIARQRAVTGFVYDQYLAPMEEGIRRFKEVESPKASQVALVAQIARKHRHAERI